MLFTYTESKCVLLLIRALTPLHVGSGRGASTYVDVPVQRDEFGFPTIWSSSLKGALKAGYKDKGCEWRALFGFEPEEQPFVSEYSSALSFTDARLVLVPARVLNGVWFYLTSPHMLTYLNLYSEVAGLGKVEVPAIGNGTALISKQELVSSDGSVLVNEMSVKVRYDPNLVERIFGHLLPSEILNNVKAKGLIVVSDDVSKLLVNRSMLIQYRVRLDRNTKTVAERSLWSEEYLPSESLLASLIVFREVKKIRCQEKELSLQVDEVKNKVINNYNGKAIFIGGKETIGRGLAKLYLVLPQ